MQHFPKSLQELIDIMEDEKLLIEFQKKKKPEHSAWFWKK